MAQNAPRDENNVPALLGTSSADGTPVTVYADPSTHRLLVSSSGGGSGTVTGVLVATANGFAGTSDANPATPTLTLSTTITGILQGNGTAISAAATNGTGAVSLTTSPAFVTPSLGVATATTLAIGGATIGANALALTGTILVSGAITSSSGTSSFGAITLAAAQPITWSGRGIISSPASGTLQLGAADAAAPVAQILRAQSVVAGTTDTAGQNFNIDASVGTGTGVGGNIIFNGAPHSTTGSTQNALSPILTLNGDTLSASFAGSVGVSGGLAVTGNISLSAGTNSLAWTGRASLNSPTASSIQLRDSTATNSVDFTVGAANLLTLNGGLTTGGNINTGGTFIFTANNALLEFRNGGTFLFSPATATLQLGANDAATPAVQTLTVQNVIAGTSNAAGANWTIAGSRGTGTGVGGSLIFQTAPAGTTGTAQNALATALTIDSTGLATFTNNVVASATDGPLMRNINSSTTVPTFAPDKVNFGTGIGGTGGNLSLIVSSAEIARATTTELISNVPIRLKGYTVGTLPAGTQGDTAFVTDALGPTFLTIIVGGGAVVTPVFYNGTNWVGY